MATQNFGIIKACKTHSSKCRFACCKFTDNYIVLYPGEFEKSKLNKNHLKIIDDDYFGGKKAVCLRRCLKGDFKPLDCKSYPYFPKINSNGKIGKLRGKKCPLTRKELNRHESEFMKIWKDLIMDNSILQWLKRVELVGYELDK